MADTEGGGFAWRVVCLMLAIQVGGRSGWVADGDDIV